MPVKGFRCSCFFTDNFFSNLLQGHFRFVDKQSFLRDYGLQQGLTPSSKTASQVNVDEVIAELEEEFERREGLSAEIVRRKKEILDSYIPKQPQLYAFRSSFLAPEFVRLVERCRGDETKPDLVALLEADATLGLQMESSHYSPVFSFPVFTKDFCSLLLEELGHFESSPQPKGRPNTMNRRGVLLDELLSFDQGFIDVFRSVCIQPVVERLIPGYEGVDLDSQKAFTVSYREGEDVELLYHYDNAEVTLNVCLGSDFTDGELYFGDVKRPGETNDAKQVRFAEIKHVIGRGILHLGAHRHGALPIGDGERHNLILWFRSSQIRNLLCPMCGKEPELVPVEAGGDGFTSS